ncbi:MAG: HPr family phosphocarrier protein, partial [Actinobacteria bacterium]|nr:HPr family phosphocarrier protein [Actinomycetota bacterium]
HVEEGGHPDLRLGRVNERDRSLAGASVIGIVIVSHSQPLAEAVVELARGMGESSVPMIAAGGVDDPDNPIGTDAMKVMAAIEELSDSDGILVLMDLGSAVLSAETALDFLDKGLRAKVRLSSAPLVEAAVATAAVAGAGADLEAVVAEATRALDAKRAHLGDVEAESDESPPVVDEPGDVHEIEIDVTPEHGLHARPAVRFVKTAGGFDADVQATNLTTGKGPVNAASMVAVATLGAARGHRLRVTATGPDAAAALAALTELAATGFGDG